MSKLERRVVAVAESALATRKVVSAVDVLTGLRWVRVGQVDTWRQGRLDALEAATAVDARKLVDAVSLLRSWAEQKGLVAGEASYVAASRDRRALRFTRTGDDAVEQAFRIEWSAADLSAARRQRLAARQQAVPDLVVHVATGVWVCDACDGTAPYQVPEGDERLCPGCADLDHLVFLPAGNAALSRRAKKESTLSAIVVRYNRRRKRYERQGILVEEGALARAEESCLADEDARERRRQRDEVRRDAADVAYQAALAGRITALFPGCSPERADAIARRAGERSSGRVGRSAAAKALDEQAVTLAVVASVRHEDTEYDALLMAGVPRREARDRIRTRLDAVLTTWRTNRRETGL
ncbi:DUF2293 domain-containing protein [Cryptosporangium aurantiacum]|uniref:DUF2293 domain-containing protein n=1 Tax=Cryptosporangium aurantiacum TaxID=134849 RepID=UPI000932CF64|nr:DUF2293 domain-containing protein [Cryptosporangium aurantiacum]